MWQGLSALALLICVTASPFCPRGSHYWNTSQQQCSNCTTCSEGQVVLRPCQPHTDTYCGPLSALRIDWSFARPQKQTTSSTSSVITPRVSRPVRKKVSTTTSTSTTITPVITEKIINNNNNNKVDDPTTLEELISTPLPSPPQLPPIPPRPVVSAQPFSAAETLVWDWQAFILVVAVTSCVIFLVLLAVYAVYQSRGARRTNNLQKELDDAAAHLSLFTSGSSDQSELCAGDLPRPPPLPDIYATNQCIYLEKLLERKQRQNDRGGTRGNIYVETGRQATPAPARRSTRWKTRQSALR